MQVEFGSELNFKLFLLRGTDKEIAKKRVKKYQNSPVICLYLRASKYFTKTPNYATKKSPYSK